MGSRLSFSSRQEPTGLTPHHNSEAESHAHTSDPRIRSLSHMPTSSESAARHPRNASERRRSAQADVARQNEASVMALNRLIAELENSGLSNEDAQLLRLIQNYRSSSSSGHDFESGSRRTARSQSLADSWLLVDPAGASRPHPRHSGPPPRHRRARRGRTTSTTIPGENEERNEASTSRPTEGAASGPVRLTAAGRHALLSLAAASRNLNWREELLLLDGADRRCIFCKRIVPHDEYDLHYVMCLTRPRVTYNEDKLQTDKGECAICLEDLKVGDSIARLPCLCIYHKRCIDLWFQRKQTCPEHPGD
ncbi:E3 ubiquitin-protein ligase znrf2 [Sparganum proliferum]